MDARSHKPDPGELLAHAAWVRSLAARLVADPHEAQEVEQETWMAALRAQGGVRGSLRGWLTRVARNAAYQRHRRQQRRVRREQRAASGPGPGTDPRELAEKLELQHRLARMVGDLPEPFRATLLLRHYEGLEPVEIARREGLPGGTVRWRLRRGLELLRQRLDAEHQGRREVWRQLLLPLAATVPGAQAQGAAAASGILGGLLAMSTSMKLLAGAGVAAFLVGLADWAGWFDGGGDEARPPDPGTSPELVGEATPPAEPPETAGPVEVTPFQEAGPDQDQAGGRSVAGDRKAPANGPAGTVTARVVDTAGQPVPGCLLHTRWGEGRSGTSGRVELALDLHREGATHVAASFACEGYATAFAKGVLRPGKELHLGEVVLEPGGNVSGVVVDPEGRPLGEARVWESRDGRAALEVQRMGVQGAVPWNAVTTRTAGDGSFLLEGVHTGRIRVAAWRKMSVTGVSSELEVSPGATVEGVRLTLEPVPDERLIAGRVVDPEGEPAARARILASYRSDTGSGSLTRTAGAQGRFRFVCPGSGRYSIVARAAEGLAQTVAEDVAPGTHDLLLRLRPPRRVRFVVEDPSGSSVADYQVRASLLEGHNAKAVVVERLPHAVPGGGPTHALQAPPGKRFLLNVQAEGRAAAELGPFLLEDVPAELTCTLEAAQQVTGRVLAGGKPAAGARVSLHAVVPEGQTRKHNGFVTLQDPDTGVEAVTGADGRFRMTPRRSGRFFLRAEKEGLAAGELGPLELGPEAGASGLELRLTRGGAIEGRVITADGSSPAGTVVGISRADGHPRTRRVGPDGRYRFDGLMPGRWIVRRAEKEISPLVTNTEVRPGNPRPLPWSCTVSEGQTTHHDLDLSGRDAAASVSGRLAFDGQPARGWRVRLVPAGTVLVRGDAPKARTGDQGRFHITAPGPGVFLLLANRAGPDGMRSLVKRLELVRGANPWSLDVPTGRLAGTLPAEAAEGCAHVLAIPGGGILVTMLKPGPQGRLEPVRVPAGTGKLLSARKLMMTQDPEAVLDLEGFQEVTVPAGGSVTLGR